MSEMLLKKCPQCGTLNSQNQSVCKNCSTSLELVKDSYFEVFKKCPECGTLNNITGSSNCRKCSSDISLVQETFFKPVKKCSGCGTLNQSDSDVCEKCHSDLSTIKTTYLAQKPYEKRNDSDKSHMKSVKECPYCGIKNDKNAKKCIWCSEDISNIKPEEFEEDVEATSSHPIGINLSVIVAIIFGFTGLLAGIALENIFLAILFIGIALLIICTNVSTKRNNERKENLDNSIKRFEETDTLTATKQVRDGDNKYLIILDDTHKKWAFVEESTGKERIYRFSDLIEYEVLENGNSVIQGRVGSAIAGGLLLGGVGAIAGASASKKVNNTCRSMSVRIVVDDASCSQIEIPLINTECSVDGGIYYAAHAKAQEFTSLLAIIKRRAEEEKHISVAYDSKSVSDEIEKLFALKEKGIITEDEFSQKKKELLSKI